MNKQRDALERRRRFVLTEIYGGTMPFLGSCIDRDFDYIPNHKPFTGECLNGKFHLL